jgi:hypothetical protein
MADRYVHKDHPKTTSDRKQMQFWMGRSRETQFAWAIFDVLTPEQQAAVLAKFGWTKVSTDGVKVCQTCALDRAGDGPAKRCPEGVNCPHGVTRGQGETFPGQTPMDREP